MNHITTKWLLVNIPLLIAISAAFIFGIAQPLFIKDITYITHIIFIVFIYGIFQSYRLASQMESNLLNKSTYEKWYDIKSHMLVNISEILLTLGFIGTIVGIIIGLQNFSTDMFSNATKLHQFIETMFIGFSIEITTLLFSAVCKFYLDIWLFIFKNSLLSEYES